MTKQIHIKNSLLKELFYSLKYGYRKSDFPDWQYIETVSVWDGGEDRHNSVIVKNIPEDYYLEITNYYDSWNEEFEPVLRIVKPYEKTITVVDYLTVEGIEIVV